VERFCDILGERGGEVYQQRDAHEGIDTFICIMTRPVLEPVDGFSIFVIDWTLAIVAATSYLTLCRVAVAPHPVCVFLLILGNQTCERVQWVNLWTPGLTGRQPSHMDHSLFVRTLPGY